MSTVKNITGTIKKKLIQEYEIITADEKIRQRHKDISVRGKQKIYLYIKISPKGLFYLGRFQSRKRKDLTVYTYKGSGYRWVRHLKKHRVKNTDIQTIILYESYDFDEIKMLGSYYSKLFDVVNNDVWANLVKESGLGAPPSESTKEIIRKTNKSRSKTVIQLDLNYNILREWSGVPEIGFKNMSGIYNCIAKDITHTAQGIRWIYKSKYLKLSDQERNPDLNRMVAKIDKSSNTIIDTYSSVLEAATKNSILQASLSSVLNNTVFYSKKDSGKSWTNSTAGGYKWEYVTTKI